jgi:hypothetical protein
VRASEVSALRALEHQVLPLEFEVHQALHRKQPRQAVEEHPNGREAVFRMDLDHHRLEGPSRTPRVPFDYPLRTAEVGKGSQRQSGLQCDPSHQLGGDQDDAGGARGLGERAALADAAPVDGDGVVVAFAARFVLRCNVLRCGSTCNVLYCGATCCPLVQRAVLVMQRAVLVMQRAVLGCNVLYCDATCCMVLQRAVLRCNVLCCVATCCPVLRCGARSYSQRATRWQRRRRPWPRPERASSSLGWWRPLHEVY